MRSQNSFGGELGTILCNVMKCNDLNTASSPAPRTLRQIQRQELNKENLPTRSANIFCKNPLLISADETHLSNNGRKNICQEGIDCCLKLIDFSPFVRKAPESSPGQRPRRSHKLQSSRNRWVCTSHHSPDQDGSVVVIHIRLRHMSRPLRPLASVQYAF